LAECTLENYDKDREGWQIIGLCYKDCFTSFSVLYKAIALESIAVTTMPQTAYIEGQPLQLAGGVLTLTYNNGDTEELALTAASVTVSGYKKNEIGTQPLTVTYGGKETSFEVAVRAKALTGISIQTAPLQNTYYVGETPSAAGGMLLLTYDNDTTELLPMVADGVLIDEFYVGIIPGAFCWK
jgi:hypothetical protein